jgi:anti-sigma-K factor RskA
MKLHLHPELLDRLAASYAVGTLRGPARRRFETLTRENAVIRASALIWQGRLASLSELQPSAQPAPEVWTRIDNLVQAQREHSAMIANRTKNSASQPPRWVEWFTSLTVWRTTSAAFVLATVVAINWGLGGREQLSGQIAQLQNQLQTTPQVSYVAVLSDNRAAASMLVTFDPRNKKLTLQRVGAYQEANDRSLQLWALVPNGAPKSLGVLSQDRVLKLTAAESDVRAIPTLAISLEPRGGVPSEKGPTGPVLFKGALIQKVL